MNAISQSRGLSVHGYVRNEPDGGVLMDIEGSVTDLKELKQRIISTMTDNIEDVVVEEHPIQDIEDGFRIRN
jgi:acylphosphatase